MKRRGFFKSLLGIGAAAALPPVKQLEAAPVPLQEATFVIPQPCVVNNWRLAAGMGDYVGARFPVPQIYGPFPSTNTITFDYASPEAK